MSSSKAAPETHPNYRPPVDMPPLQLGGAVRPVRRPDDDLSEPHRFVASGLLSPSECSAIISAAEHAGLAGVEWEYDPSYRDCRRVVMRSRPLADAVYARLLPLLSDAECERVRPFGFDGDGDWRPCKANEVVRVSRYDAGGKFDRHRDGAFVENDDVRSVYTVLVYLNGPPAFGGGATRVFLQSAATSGGGGSEVEMAVVPRTGAALVMTHDTEHAGEVVTSGHKYVARFDLMFRRLGGSMTEAELARLPDRALAEGLYASSIVKQRNGDPRGSTEDYVRALNLQARLPSAGDGDDPRSFPLKSDGSVDLLSDTLFDDSFVRVLRFLEPKEIARASEASRRWRSACASGLLWRELFVLRWPTLSPGEATVLGGPDEARRMPSAVYDDPASAERWRGQRSLHTVFVAVLPRRGGSDALPLHAGGQEKLRKLLYGYSRENTRVPPGYMYSSLRMSGFNQVSRRNDGGIRWKRFHAFVRSGCIHFAEYSESAERERRNRWYGRSQRDEYYDASMDAEMRAPPPIPIEHDTNLSFSFGPDVGGRPSTHIDSCIVELGGTADGGYLVICKNDPRKEPEAEYYFSSTFVGILEDIARVVVGRQTEAALQYGNVAVKCDAKTKQWKTAYARRHIAEKFFDVVTIDIGQRQTKFAANDVMVEDILQRSHDSGWSELRQIVVHRFFVRAIQKYGRDEGWVPIALKSLHGVATSGKAAFLLRKASNDPELRQEIPLVFSEASRGCGSMASLVRPARGHLWSAGHGLQNHNVGDACVGLDNATAPFDAEDQPDCNKMAIICAHVVTRTSARRVCRNNHFIRMTCAEHPVNIVEPALGFSEEVRMQLVEKLASFHVPFVGFVNGAAAALMCGETPRRDGIVVMLGGVNSAVVPIVDGVADTSRGVPLSLPPHDAEESIPDDPRAVAEEAGAAVRRLLAPVGSAASGPVPVLLTGGRASDAVVAAMGNGLRGAAVCTASGEGERHLDAARGAHVLANLSDGRKHFRTVLHTMWSLDGNGTH